MDTIRAVHYNLSVTYVHNMFHLHPLDNLGLPGLKFGHKFKVDPTWAFPQCILENTKTSLDQQQGESERRKSIIWLANFRLSNFVVKDV